MKSYFYNCHHMHVLFLCLRTLEQILTEAEQLTRSGGLRKKNLNAFQYFMREHTQTLKTDGKNENLRGVSHQKK